MTDFLATVLAKAFVLALEALLTRLIARLALARMQRGAAGGPVLRAV